jgi:hypothetical protein
MQLYSGSRIDLSGRGIPAGLEALTGNRMAPSFVLPGGFPGQPETDHLDFLQVGWTHLLPAASCLGAISLTWLGVVSLRRLSVKCRSVLSRLEKFSSVIKENCPLAQSQA